MHGRSFFIDFHFRLHSVEIFFTNKRRNSVRNYHVAELVFAYVLTVGNSTLKKFRERAGLTQQLVADSIGIQVRTYQKWEKGEAKPDGYNLIRLMNLLDIDSVQDFLKNTPIEDDNNYTKFRNRKKYN